MCLLYEGGAISSKSLRLLLPLPWLLLLVLPWLLLVLTLLLIKPLVLPRSMSRYVTI